MNLLSPEAQQQLVTNLVTQCDQRIIEVLEQNYAKPPYIQQKELMAELGVNYPYLKKLEDHGLKRVKLDPKDKTIFYRRSDVYQLFDELAERA